MMYAIMATREETRDDGWTATRQIPTFYLDSNAQGIVDAPHAERIARGLLLDAAGVATGGGIDATHPLSPNKGHTVRFHITAVALEHLVS